MYFLSSHSSDRIGKDLQCLLLYKTSFYHTVPPLDEVTDLTPRITNKEAPFQEASRGLGRNEFWTCFTCYPGQRLHAEPPGRVCSHQNHSSRAVVERARVGSCDGAWKQRRAWGHNTLPPRSHLVQLNALLQSTTWLARCVDNDQDAWRSFLLSENLHWAN